MRDRLIVASGAAAGLALVADLMILPLFFHAVATRNVADALAFGTVGVAVAFSGTGLALLAVRLIFGRAVR